MRNRSLINQIRRWLADKIAPAGESAGTWQRCHLCKGTGQVWQMEGWFAPGWEDCAYCDGTGEAPETLSCGCTAVRGKIISCYPGHGHVSGSPKRIDRNTVVS